MKIKSEKTIILDRKGSRHSYKITPEMGIVSHFPSEVCKGLIALGAIEIKKALKKPAEIEQ